MNSQFSNFLNSLVHSSQEWGDCLIAGAVGYVIIYFLMWYGFIGKLGVDTSTEEDGIVIFVTWFIISLCVVSCIEYLKIIILTGIFL